MGWGRHSESGGRGVVRGDSRHFRADGAGDLAAALHVAASDSTSAGFLPVPAATPVPAAAPTPAPMAAPLPPPAMAPMRAPKPAPPPILVTLLLAWDSPLTMNGSTARL